MRANDGYSHAAHVRAVIKAAKVTDTAMMILLAAVSPIFAEFDRPETTFTKDQMCDLLGRSRKPIQNGLAILRESGILRIKSGLEGGRHVPTTYRVCIAGQGDRVARVGEGRGESREDARLRVFSGYTRKHGYAEAVTMIEDWDRKN